LTEYLIQKIQGILQNTNVAENSTINYSILLKKIVEFRICEKDHETIDSLLNLIEIMIHSLFNMPSRLSTHRVPMEDDKERKCMFNLLLEISKFAEQLIPSIITRFSEHFEEDQSAHGFYMTYESRTYDQFAGLRNLRNTCYMNSVIQQLYFIDEFREFVLEHPPLATNKENTDSVYRELRIVFASLKSSILKTIIPINFAKNFRAFDGEPINPNQQQDANEFYSLLLNEIETHLKEQPQNIVKDFFMGMMVNKIVSLESEMPFESRNEEPFMTILLDIKHCRNIFDALDQFTRSEVMDDENKYYCDKYETKIKAIRKCEFKNFPPCLTFTLNRFAFDQKTFTRVKLNDYFEFPFELNLENWNEQISEGGSAASMYKLVGVVIHSGVAESGHYYSYIFKGSKWYEFNDTKVTEKDITSVF
jgi:ubiquitin carboxyl-terminal hydrolase 34